MSAASGASIMRTAAKRALSKIARVGIFALYAAKLRYEIKRSMIIAEDTEK